MYSGKSKLVRARLVTEALCSFQDDSDFAIKEMYVLGPEYELIATNEIAALSVRFIRL